MITINRQSPLESILPFVRNWAQLLADGRLTEACTQIDEPFYDDEFWTPELILSIVHNTFTPQSRFYSVHPEGPIFTSPYELNEQTQLIEDWLENYNADDNIISFDYALPLNDEWNDLTALFEFHKQGDIYAVALRDVHVL